MTERDPDPFNEFDRRLRQARKPERDDEEPAGPGDYGPGLQAGIDVFAGVVGGALIGWALDNLFDTSPVLLVVFFFLGAVAGMRNAFRTLQRLVRDDDER